MLSRINVHLNCKPVLKVQFLNYDNSGIIRSFADRADKGYLSVLRVEETHGLGVVIKSKAGERVCLNGINAFLLG